MKFNQKLCFLVALLLLLPMLAQAEMYKWKDKNGITHYTDTPPPTNIKQETLGSKKVAKPTSNSAPVPVANAQPALAKDAKQTPAGKDAKQTDGKGESAQDEAAKKRQENAEIEKRNKQEKEAQAKLKAENCKAAKSNLESYKQGGRVYKMNEKGEREYMDDAGLKEGANKAQGEVNEYCNG